MSELRRELEREAAAVSRTNADMARMAEHVRDFQPANGRIEAKQVLGCDVIVHSIYELQELGRNH